MTLKTVPSPAKAPNEGLSRSAECENMVVWLHRAGSMGHPCMRSRSAGAPVPQDVAAVNQAHVFWPMGRPVAKRSMSTSNDGLVIRLADLAWHSNAASSPRTHVLVVPRAILGPDVL